MKKESRAVYYVTTEDKKLSVRERVPVYHCDRTLPYKGGEIHVFFSLMPSDLKEEFQKKRNRTKRSRQLSEAMEWMQRQINEGVEILFSEDLCRIFDREQSISDELYAAWLFQRLKGRTVSHFCLSLPEEYGFLMREKVLFLLEPYLKRINRITFLTGQEPERGTDERMEELAEYFYEEYGILSGQAGEPEEGSFCLKLSDDAEILNFLDTAVKSGYNTKVD